MSDHVLALAAFIISIAAALFTGWQAVSNHRTARIEMARRRAELTPQFSATPIGGGGYPMPLVVELKLTGPNGLDQVDHVWVRIEDDAGADDTQRRIRRSASTAARRRSAAVRRYSNDANEVWGPYALVRRQGRRPPSRFGTRRSTGPFNLTVGDTQRLELRMSDPPTEVSDADKWSNLWVDRPVRLEITGRRRGASWRVRLDVPVPPGDPSVLDQIW